MSRSNQRVSCLLVSLLLFVGTLPSIAASADVAELLRQGDFAALDATFVELQKQFEQGIVSEIDLRNAYRPFYEPSPEGATNLHRWVKESPNSYAAHLAEGIFYKKQGQKARGGRFISETSNDSLVKMGQAYSKARTELLESEKLSAKPYLSVFHLLDIAAQEGDAKASLALLRQANQMLPKNELARDRYFHSLMPRWGGSYSQAQAFIESTKTERLPERSVMRLKAILEDDMGETLARDGNFGAARPHFVSALTLSKEVGGSFRSDFLSFSTEYFCPREPASELCH